MSLQDASEGGSPGTGSTRKEDVCTVVPGSEILGVSDDDESRVVGRLERRATGDLGLLLAEDEEVGKTLGVTASQTRVWPDSSIVLERSSRSHIHHVQCGPSWVVNGRRTRRRRRPPQLRTHA